MTPTRRPRIGRLAVTGAVLCTLAVYPAAGPTAPPPRGPPPPKALCKVHPFAANCAPPHVTRRWR